MTMATRPQKCGISTTFRTNSIRYHNSFLPRTIHDLKNGESEKTTVSYSVNTGLLPPMPNCLLTRLSASLIMSMQQLLWASSSKKDISNIEQLQDQAVRFIAGINFEGMDGVENVKTTTRLGLIPLHKRRRNQRLRLLMRILAKEKHHPSLSESYNEIMKQPATTMTTRSQTRRIPATFRTNNTQYHNSFLP